MMAPAFNRGGGYQSITLRMQTPRAIRALNVELQRNPRMQVQVAQESSAHSSALAKR